jgi:ABC-type multidrug transport system fused ATPase/permease subunit
MARALLRHSHILVMDEATASIDYHTDSIIQNMIQFRALNSFAQHTYFCSNLSLDLFFILCNRRNEFRDRTVLTIAHRLNTILWMDRVMVLEQGRLVEFDSPDALMQKPDGVFRSMISDFEAGKA